MSTSTEHPYERYLRLNPPMTAEQLEQAIAGTNNGYMFAPTGDMVACAHRHPERFTTTPNSLGSTTIRLRK
jgi:hypothetical protein